MFLEFLSLIGVCEILSITWFNLITSYYIKKIQLNCRDVTVSTVVEAIKKSFIFFSRNVFSLVFSCIFNRQIL